MLSSIRRPIPLRSSDTKPIPLLRISRGRPKGSFFPLYMTSPVEGYRPAIPLAMASFPCPASPQNPSISPLCISISTPFTFSPGILTPRPLICMIGPFFPISSGGLPAMAEKSTFLPTISFASPTTSTSPFPMVSTSSPSLSTTILSDISMTSSSLWLMKITATPAAEISLIVSRSQVDSMSVRTAVGSSNTISLIFFLSISLAISTNCL